jgi:hypothetical protein
LRTNGGAASSRDERQPSCAGTSERAGHPPGHLPAGITISPAVDLRARMVRPGADDASLADALQEPPMPMFKLPLSGDVVQSINPFTAFMTGGQFGLININLGQSSKPEIEQDVLTDVASYGKQLGRIGDALAVLLAHFHPDKALTADEDKAIEALKDMLAKIADVKQRHGRAALRPAGEAQPS